MPGRKVVFTVEVTGYEPNRMMSASWSEPLTGNWEARFEPTDTRTRLDFTTEINPTGFMGLMAPLMKAWATRGIEKILAAFKDSVESTTSDS